MKKGQFKNRWVEKPLKPVSITIPEWIHRRLRSMALEQDISIERAVLRIIYSGYTKPNSVDTNIVAMDVGRSYQAHRDATMGIINRSYARGFDVEYLLMCHGEYGMTLKEMQYALRDLYELGSIGFNEGFVKSLTPPSNRKRRERQKNLGEKVVKESDVVPLPLGIASALKKWR